MHTCTLKLTDASVSVENVICFCAEFMLISSAAFHLIASAPYSYFHLYYYFNIFLFCRTKNLVFFCVCECVQMLCVLKKTNFDN